MRKRKRNKNNKNGKISVYGAYILVPYSAPVSGQLTVLGCSDGVSSISDRNSDLTPVSIPYSLSPQFLRISAENNSKNVETCGILFGKLNLNKFTITHCLIPKQKGTHDSCSTTNEEQILEFQGFKYFLYSTN